MARPAKKRQINKVSTDIILSWDMILTESRSGRTSQVRKALLKRKAQEYMDEQRIAEFTGQTLIGDSVSFAKYAEHLLKVYKKPTVKANTYAETYEQTVESYLILYFRDALLTKIKSGDIQVFSISCQQSIAKVCLIRCGCAFTEFSTQLLITICVIKIR